MKRIRKLIIFWRPWWFFLIDRRLMKAKRADEASEQKWRALYDGQMIERVRPHQLIRIDMDRRFQQLEERVDRLERVASTMWEGMYHQPFPVLEAATPSPVSDSPMKDCLWDATEPDYIPRLSPASWRSGHPTTPAGLVEPASGSVPSTDVPT